MLFKIRKLLYWDTLIYIYVRLNLHYKYYDHVYQRNFTRCYSRYIYAMYTSLSNNWWLTVICCDDMNTKLSASDAFRLLRSEHECILCQQIWYSTWIFFIQFTINLLASKHDCKLSRHIIVQQTPVNMLEVMTNCIITYYTKSTCSVLMQGTKFNVIVDHTSPQLITSILFYIS